MAARKAKWLHRIAKHEQAKTRQLECSKLTPEQRLRRLNEQGYTASKERKKLLAQIESKRSSEVRTAR